MKNMNKGKRWMPTEADIRWANHYAWDYKDGGEHREDRFVCRIPMPFSVMYWIYGEDVEGWVIHSHHIGILQEDSPFSSPRAAIRLATAMSLNRNFVNEMSCAEEF